MGGATLAAAAEAAPRIVLSAPQGGVTWQTAGILAAAAYNFCILLVTKGLTSKSFFKVDPLFDRNGCVLVLVWGLAYLSTAWSYSHTPWTMAVFALEKAFYAAHWARTVRSLKASGALFAAVFFAAA